MEGRCAKHQFEAAEDACRSCGNEFCGDCLVYSFGPKKPPYCIACALTAAGVRTTAANHPTKTKKELKQEARARRKADRQAVKSGAPGMDVEWSMPEDPTAGLTEEDLRLPTAPPDAAVPPPPPPPPPPPLAGEDPAKAELPAAVVLPAPDPEPTGSSAPESVSATSSPTEPPQFLLRHGPVPDLPGAELPAPAPLLAPVDTTPPPPAPPSALGLEDLVGLAPVAPAPPTVEPPPVVTPPPASGPGAADVPAPEAAPPTPPGQEPPQFLLRQAAPPPRLADEVPLPVSEPLGDDPFGVGAVIPVTPPPPPPPEPFAGPAATAGPAALEEFGLGPVVPTPPSDSATGADLPRLGAPPAVDAPGPVVIPSPGDEPFVATADEPEPFEPLPFERTGVESTTLGPPPTAEMESAPFEPAPFEPAPIEPPSFEPAASETAASETAASETGAVPPPPPPPPPPPGLPRLAPATIDADQLLSAPPPPPPSPPPTPPTPAQTLGVDLGFDAPAPAEPRVADPEPPATDPEPPVIGADDLFAPGTEAPAPGHAPFDASTFAGDALTAPAPALDPLDDGADRRLDRPFDPPPHDGVPSTWELSGKPLRVRDLLDDPGRPAPLGPRPADTSGFTPRTVPGDEPAFFAPVTPEQLGEDPWPPAPPS